MQIPRQKMSKTTYQALKKYIMRERERKKQEQEQDKEQTERIKREREMKKKKEEADSLTLEQTKEQISQLEAKLTNLKQEKHELFAQLKKVLHIESTQRQRAQLKEQQNEQTALQQQYVGPNVVHPQLMLQQQQRQKTYMTIPPPQTISSQGIKRNRSPSPPSGQFYAPPQSVHLGSNKSDAYNIKTGQYPGMLGNFQGQTFAATPLASQTSSTTPTPSKYLSNSNQFYSPHYANTHKGDGQQYASINYRAGMMTKRSTGSYMNDHLPPKQNYPDEKPLKIQAPTHQQILASQMGGLTNINEASIMPPYKNQHQTTNYNQINQRSMMAPRGIQFKQNRY